MSLRLSVLDQSPISEGSTGSQALHNTIDLARLTDALGYHRYWVAEHHGGPMLAGPSPEALIGPIASATERIRVGSGGVMLPHYSPFKVAETFSVLAGLYPGRIDLGLGRAAGTDPMTTHALQRDRSRAMPDDFPQQLAELLAYYEDTVPLSSPLARLAKVLPGRPETPEPWLLGSSPQSAVWAGELGLPYAFADFINPAGAEIAALYRRDFADGVRLDAPRTAVAVWALAADSEEEARPALHQQPDGVHDAAPRTADRGSPARDGRALPRLRGRRAVTAQADDRRARRPRCAKASRRPRATTGPKR